MPTVDLCNHWIDKQEWYQDRQLWAFYLTFHGQADLHRRVDRDQAVLRALPALDLIQQANLHLSVQGVGFVDEVGERQMEELADVVRAQVRGCGLPKLLVGEGQLDYDAISLPVTPVGGLVQIKDVIKKAAARILDGQAIYQLPEPPGGFDPHISIAYANDYISPEDLAPVMSRLEAEPLAIEVSGLSLVKLKRQQRTWFWTDEQRFGLAREAQGLLR